MIINHEKDDSLLSIRHYSAHSVTINDIELSTSFLLLPSELIPDFPAQSFHKLDETFLTTIIERRPEILLIGTGERSQLLPTQLRYLLESQGIGVECMNTAAACRSYNILSSEQRSVAALIFL